MGTSATAAAMAPLLLRNLITTIFISADKSLHTLSTKFKLLQFIRHLLTSFLLYFLRILPYALNPPRHTHHPKAPKPDAFEKKSTNVVDSGIGRALSQLLLIVNDIPVSSRKYEVVRSMAERIVEDNNREGLEKLREVNRKVLSAAFERTLRRLENAALSEERGDLRFRFGPLQAEFYYLGKCLKALRYVGDAAWARVVKPRSFDAAAESSAGGGGSAEKLAAEALWLAEKLAACGYVEEAVRQWGSASSLAWMSLMAEPRLQSSLTKVSAFLLKQDGDLGKDAEQLVDDQNLRQMKMEMLISWLPLLCRGSNGTDAPVLSAWERAELERILEEMIDELDCVDDQEKVLSLWLHHFTYSPSSDWPNLRECYARWCAASRKRLLLQ